MVAVFRQTPEGHLLDCNDQCARLLGYDNREELLGAGRFEYQNQTDLVSVATALHDLGSLSNVEIALVKKGGGVVWVLQNLKLVSVDEFIFLVGDSGSGTESAIVAQRVLDAMNRPFNVGGRPIELTASVGISMSDRDSNEVENLVRHASTAMFRAKEFGRNLYQFYDEKLNAHTLERLALVSSVRRALDRGEFELFYQPEVDVQTGRIACVEAFLRWRHPDLGIIGPPEFLA